MPSFTDALDKNFDDIERPKNLPVGNYIWVVEKQPAFEKAKDGSYEFLDFQLKCVAPSDDVDPDALREFGDTSNVRQRLRFIFSTTEKNDYDRALFNLKRFLEEHLQVEAANIKEALAKSVGHQCMAEVSWQPDKNDPEVIYTNIRRTAPVV